MSPQARRTTRSRPPRPSSAVPARQAWEARVAGGRHNLPHVPASFVGRDHEAAEVTSTMAGARLVTITGLGGVGKSRLALEVAGTLISDHPYGVWIVDLSEVQAPAALPAAVAGAVQWLDSEPANACDLGRMIGERSLLLLLDNCETLLAPAARLVDTLLRACPGLSVLATSRERLGIVGEHRYGLGPLSVPGPGRGDPGAVAASESGQLFLERAAASTPGVVLTDELAAQVAEIVRRLDGLPLAIELVTSRMASLSAADVVARLGDPFRLLVTQSRTVAPRHRSLRAALEASAAVLAPAESILLSRLSVFSGWTLTAAEAVCSGGGVDRADVIDHLSSLVDRSLVLAESGPLGTRYRLLETVRTWATWRLGRRSEAAQVARRHASWCADLAEEADRTLRIRADHLWLDRLDVERDNLLAALEWSRAAGELELALRVATSLTTYWRRRGLVAEGVEWLEWAVAEGRGVDAGLRARALRGAGLLRGMLGDVGRAIPLLEQSSALFDEVDGTASECDCNPIRRMFRNPRQGVAEFEEKIAFARRTGDGSRLAHLLYGCGQAQLFLGEVAEARRCLDDCLHFGRGAADGAALRRGLVGLARIALLQGDYAEAESRLDEARALAEAGHDPDDLGTVLDLLGDLARARGEWARARELLDSSVELARSNGWVLSVARSTYFLARLLEWQAPGSSGEAGLLFETSLAMNRSEEGPTFHDARCLLGMGSAALAVGEVSPAAGHLLEALEMAQSIGDRQATAHALDRLGALARIEGRVEEARTLVHRALDLHHRLGELPAVAPSLEAVAGLAADRRRWEEAARLLGAAEALRESRGFARSWSEQARFDSDREAVAAGAGAEAFADAWAAGSALSTEEAVAYASRGRGARDRPDSGWESLTPAELKVVRLVSEGLSNPEVGRRLFISSRTVGHHLAHVYRKLGIHSRGSLIKELAGQEL